MHIVINFLGMLVILSFITGLFLVLLYAIINAISNSRSYYHFPRWLRNILDSLLSFSGSMGPFFIIFFILGQFAMSILKKIL
ncbi:MAG: hypothetical protein ACRCTJ_03605 [Brevinema sp.]